MKIIKLLEDVLEGKKVTRTSFSNNDYCLLSGGKIVYSDGSEMSLEQWLRLSLDDWELYKEPITFKELKLGDLFYFDGNPTRYQKARLDFGTDSFYIGVSTKQQYSLATPDAKVKKA